MLIIPIEMKLLWFFKISILKNFAEKNPDRSSNFDNFWSTKAIFKNFGALKKYAPACNSQKYINYGIPFILGKVQF